ncbi:MULTISPECIES: chemotaxis protein CheW [unclassified Pseudoxanthomonas]|uniref:chemotaxis protein CheW n=1 Tax=unclassified Pseudoxanthomonas TaxID=2645906 RepID=UPI0030777282
MLFLLFQLGEDRYAIEATKIVAVLPLISPKLLPQAPAAVAGVFDYGGEAVPLIDLSQLALGRSARPRHSTRVLVVNYPMADGDVRYLGLIAEHAVETMACDPDEFDASGVTQDDVRYLGPVTSHPRGLLQWVRIEHLLPESVRDLLFKEQVDS